MTPFLMRFNQHDYSFMMKCLNWAISHDDGLENLLYDIPQLPSSSPSVEVKEKDPFFLTLTINCLSLLVMRKGVPLAFLVLDDLRYDFTQRKEMNMELKLFDIYGTAIEHSKQEQTLTERGMFNAIGYTKEHPFKEKVRIEELLRMFRREDRMR